MSEQQAVLEILLLDVRLSYFYGYEKQSPQSHSFGTHAIFPPTHPQVPKLVELMKQAAINGWKDQGLAIYEQLKAQDKLCLRVGNIAKPGQEGYVDQLFISANSPKRPRILATRGGVNVEVPPGQPDSPYSGCRANVKVQIWPLLGGVDKNGQPISKRICAQWQGVQFLAHGAAFGGGRIANLDEFGVVASDADATPKGASAGAAEFF